MNNDKNRDTVGMGIDFGTVNLLVYVEGQGIIFNEPSVVAYDVDSGVLIAAGKEADEMTGKTHDKIRIVRPLRDGVISDLRAAKDIIKYVFEKVRYFNTKGMRAIICCPSEVTQIERKALQQLGSLMGIPDTKIEEEIKSGVIGAGEDIYGTAGVMVIDIGGGTTDVGVLCLGDVVLSKSLRIAGNFIDGEIIKYIKQHFKLEVGVKTAERVKINLATLDPNAELETMKIAGRDLLTGLPKFGEISNKDIYKIILPIFEDIYNLVVSTLKDTPPELCSDIYYGGILLNGGGSQIDFLAEFLSERIGLTCFTAENPMTSVVLGTKVLLTMSSHNFLGKEDF